jgi:hypothetical protein
MIRKKIGVPEIPMSAIIGEIIKRPVPGKPEVPKPKPIKPGKPKPPVKPIGPKPKPEKPGNPSGDYTFQPKPGNGNFTRMAKRMNDPNGFYYN